MASNDSLDRTLAARFAWRHARPDEIPSLEGALGDATDSPEDTPEAADGEPLDGDSDDLDGDDTVDETTDEDTDGDEDGDDEPGDGDPEAAAKEMRSLESMRAAARAECARLTEAIDRTWKLRDPGLQARATEQLARHAASLGLRVAAMSEHPLQAVRLLRLVTRHHASVEEEARDALTGCVVWIDLGHPELVDLVAELAVSGPEDLQQHVLFHLSATRDWRSERVCAAWSAPLAALASRDDLSWPQRLMALSYLELSPGREAIPALRKLLRAQHLGARSIALSALRAIGPDATSDDDVRFLLEDLVEHELPEFLRGPSFEHALTYARTLTELLVERQLPGAPSVLAGLVQSRAGSAGAWGVADSLWALRVLAASAPERALPLIDDWLTHARELDRLAATESLARLPADLARPRLLTAAADGSPEVALRAGELWLTRYGTNCPVTPLAGVLDALLDAPPSEAFRGRLLVLRGRTLDARSRMVEVLLAEAPSREALALLVFALGSDDVWRHNERAALPSDQAAWVRALVQRFGDAGARGVAELAGRRSMTATNSWFQAVTWAVASLDPDATDLSAIRELAARVLVDGRYRFAQSDASKVLRALGVPLSLADVCFDWIDRRVEPAHPHIAADLLAAMGPDADIDRRVSHGLDVALRESSTERVGCYARAGAERDVDACVTQLRAILDAPGGMADLTSEMARSLTGSARALLQRDRLREGWLHAALSPDNALRGDARRRRDATRRFEVACVLVRVETDDAQGALLSAQLGPDGFSPETAALAANALLFQNKLEWDAAQLAPIAEAVDDALRLPLLHHALYHEQPLEALWGAFSKLFASREPSVVSRLARLVEDYPESLAEHLRALPSEAIADPDLAALVARTLSPPDDAPFWFDE